MYTTNLNQNQNQKTYKYGYTTTEHTPSNDLSDEESYTLALLHR